MPTGKEAPKRKDGKTSFNQLIEYIEDAEKTQDQDRALPDVWAINCLSIDTAAVEMTSTAMQNTQSEGNAAYHAIITWPQEEVPTAEQAREAGLIALKELGFDTEPGGHQALIAYHHKAAKHGTQNPHIHIAANKIHPQTLKSLHIEWSHKTLHQACRLIEIKQGWSHQKGIKEVVIDADGNEQVIDSQYRNTRNQGLSQKSLDVEKHSNMTSFERYIKETVGPLLKEELKSKNTSWQNIHDLLATYNVKIVQRGGGFSFSDQPLFLKSFTPEQRLAEVERAGKTHASASTAGSFARGAALVKKLGEFQPNVAERTLPEIRYNAKSNEGVEHIPSRNQSAPQQTTGMKLQAVSNNDQPVSEVEQDKIRLKAIFDKAMAERRSLFQAKKEARKTELTDIKKKEDRELQDSLNDSRKRAHAANAAMPPEMKLITADVNDILRLEREQKKAELKAIQTARQKKFEEEYALEESKLQKHNSFHRWLEEQSKTEGEIAEIAKRVYSQSKMREQILKEQKLDLGNETITCPASKRKTVIVLLVSQKLAQQGYKAYQNKDHVAYVKNSKVRFKDFGNNISVTFSEEDQTIRDALLLAQEKFGQTIKLKGNALFQAKAARLAYEIGIKSIQSDDPQALEIFRALKEGRVEVDLAKQHADAITNGTTPQTKYVDFDNRDEWKKLDKEADLVKIAQTYGYTIQKQSGLSGDAVRMVKDDQVLNINTGASTDTFFMKNDLGRTISGTAQDFIRKEEKIGYSDAAEKLFMLNRKLSKEIEPSSQAIKERDYDIAYVRHLFNEATNDPKKMGVLNTKGLYKNDLSGDTRVSDKGEIFFAHRDVNKNIVGFEVKTLQDRPVWFVKGGAKGVFLANEIEDSKVERVVIVMDAIEAEAIKKLELKQNKALIEKTLYLSVGGSASQKQLDYLNKFKNAEIELRVSKDTKGLDKVIEKLEHSLNVKIIHAEENPTARTAKLVKDREQQYRGLER
jgi:hypothetical protein